MKFLEQITEKTKCTEGMSPAEVYKCRLGDQTCYLKTIDSIFSPTTYSVAREAQVMRWLKGKLHVPKVLESGVDPSNREYLLMSELKGRHIDDLQRNRCVMSLIWQRPSESCSLWIFLTVHSGQMWICG